MDEQQLNKALYPDAYQKPEYVICAANWYDDGKKHLHQPKNIEQGFVVCGRRHHNCYALASIILPEAMALKGVCKQGFLTSKDRWVTRTEAGQIAFKQGQTPKLQTTLFSEDLY